MSDHEPELKDEYGEPLMSQDLCKWLRGVATDNWWADRCRVAAERLDDIYSGRAIVMPSSMAHAKAMLLMAERYIKDQSPAEVSDKRQDRKVADERPQLSREQIDDMNSGD